MILKLRGSHKDYLWGGTKLMDEYNQHSDSDIMAESWVVSTHKDGPSFIENTDINEATLKEYIENNPMSLGSNNQEYAQLPVLVKLIDSNQPLSVQVHPDDAYAQKHENDNGKNEMWVILEAKENAQLVVGLNKVLSAQQLEQSIRDNTLEQHLNYVPVKQGDVVYIPAGTIHAIGAGITICEIQQSSNVTYRLYDYNRKDNNGSTRELHIDKGVYVSNLDPYPSVLQNGYDESITDDCRFKTLVSNKYFITKQYDINNRCTIEHSLHSFLAVVVIDGDVSISYNDYSVKGIKGDSFFIGAGIHPITIKGNAKLITVSRTIKD